MWRTSKRYGCESKQTRIEAWIKRIKAHQQRGEALLATVEKWLKHVKVTMAFVKMLWTGVGRSAADAHPNMVYRPLSTPDLHTSNMDKSLINYKARKTRVQAQQTSQRAADMQWSIARRKARRRYARKVRQIHNKCAVYVNPSAADARWSKKYAPHIMTCCNGLSSKCNKPWWRALRHGGCALTHGSQEVKLCVPVSKHGRHWADMLRRTFVKAHLSHICQNMGGALLTGVGLSPAIYVWSISYQ